MSIRLIDTNSVATYQPFHAARADLLARWGRNEEATTAYDRAIELTDNPIERRFLEGQRARVIDRSGRRSVHE